MALDRRFARILHQAFLGLRVKLYIPLFSGGFVLLRALAVRGRSWRPRGSRSTVVLIFLYLSARWGGWLTPRPGRFTFGKETRYPLYRRLGGPQGWCERVRKISPPGGFFYYLLCGPPFLLSLPVFVVVSLYLLDKATPSYMSPAVFFFVLSVLHSYLCLCLECSTFCLIVFSYKV